MEKQKGLKLCAFPPLNCSPTTSTGPHTGRAGGARARRARVPGARACDPCGVCARARGRRPAASTRPAAASTKVFIYS